MAPRCLIVDDSPDFLQAARELLEDEGIPVVATAGSAEEASRCVHEHRPDVVLVDIDLGGKSGFAAAQHLAHEHGELAGSIILISSHGEEEFAELIEASPARGFVPKAQLGAAVIMALLAGPGAGG